MDYKEAAKRLGLSIPGVYKALNEGRLIGTKDEKGKWDITEEAILMFQGKVELEGDLFKAEHIMNKFIQDREAEILKKINGFCNRFTELYSAGNSNAQLWARKIADQVAELDNLKHASKLIGEALMDNLTPLEEPYSEGDENEQ